MSVNSSYKAKMTLNAKMAERKEKTMGKKKHEKMEGSMMRKLEKKMGKKS